MSRFILPLCVACVFALSLVGAFDETPDGNNSLKNATREELLEKIISLELQLEKLKSQQKQRSTQQQALTNWLTYTAPLTREAPPVRTPMPLWMFAWPSYPEPNVDGSHYPAMPNAHQGQVSDLPKGVKARPFSGVTVYNIPCVYRTVNGVPETTSGVASQLNVRPARNVDGNSDRQLVPQQDTLRRRQ